MSRDVINSSFRYILLLALGLYLTTIGFDFAYDDKLQILLNPQITESTWTWQYFQRIFTEPTPPGNLFRPLATLSYALTILSVGYVPAYFHLINVLLYCAVCALLYPLFQSVLRENRLALLATLLFTVHPLHSEAVANIIGRAEIGATLFVLLACFASERAVTRSNGSEIGVYLFLSAFSLFLASLWKESSLTACLVIPVYAWIVSPRGDIHWLKYLRIGSLLSALFGGSLASLLLRRHALGEQYIIRSDGQIWPENPLFHLPFLDRIAPGLKVLGDYIRLLILPLHQSADYSSVPSYFFDRLYSWDGVASFVAVLVFLWWGFVRRDDRNRFFALWFLASFALTINILLPIGTVMGERLAFLPSIGACALLALAIDALDCSTKLKGVTSFAFLAIFTLLTVLRVPVWRNNEVLFNQTVQDAPYSPKAHYNLGVHLVLQDPQSVEAEKEFRQACEIHPPYVLPTRALADIMLARKDWGRLEYWYRRLLELTPQDEVVKENLARLESFKRSGENKMEVK